MQKQNSKLTPLVLDPFSSRFRRPDAELASSERSYASCGLSQIT